jgi:hypothetical protein
LHLVLSTVETDVAKRGRDQDQRDRFERGGVPSMIILNAANGNSLQHYLAGKYPGKIGWMMSPSTRFFEPREWLPYAIDNGKFSIKDWSEDCFFDLLDRCQFSRYKPDWVAVPDEVGNREKTLWLWNQYEHRVRMYGWRMAFVVQDGMTPNDVPDSADIVFIGGTTKWKWRNVALFCATFPRVHVGRVNWWDKLEYCESVGAESCDGSGFFREGPDGNRAQQLIDFISGHRREKEQPKLIAC